VPIVRLYASFRQLAGVRDMDIAVPTEGTVRDVLHDLVELRPPLAGRVIVQDKVPKFVLVFVNGRDIRHLEGLDTPVQTNDEVTIFPPLAGG
jgi:molybdopterin synthase sulfur carrier subunit